LVLTKVFGDRLDGEVRLTTEEREWWQSSSVVVRYRHREVEKVLAWGAASRRGARGTFYRSGMEQSGQEEVVKQRPVVLHQRFGYMKRWWGGHLMRGK
jgi:hypothetical protein